MKVAIVHYWLVGMRGGEKVVEALCEMFPEADVYTNVFVPEAISDTIKQRVVDTTFIQKLPRAAKWYQRYLPLMPLALEQLDLSDYDLVISSESGPAKGVIVHHQALHVCYCHTPMRYLWDMYHDYLGTAGRLSRLLIRPLTHYLRMWDVSTAARVDQFVTNSEYVAQRVMKYYRRDAVVIPPPVETEAFSPSEERGDFYLVVGQLVRYKRADLAVEAFNRLGKPLVVIGDGDCHAAIKRAAKSNIELLGWQPTSVLRDYYARCRALVFPGIEDFGIVPVEAMASGRPVIAYRKGGATETIVDGETGIFFDEQTPESLGEAVTRFERTEQQFVPARIVAHAGSFDQRYFKQRMQDTIDRLLDRRERTIPPAST
jgi:glycosyltransferase involved in cell wall biosynthesis